MQWTLLAWRTIWEQYEVVTAPLLYMTKGNTDEKIRQFVKKGGTFITSYFSGIVDELTWLLQGAIGKVA